MKSQTIGVKTFLMYNPKQDATVWEIFIVINPRIIESSASCLLAMLRIKSSREKVGKTCGLFKGCPQPGHSTKLDFMHP